MPNSLGSPANTMRSFSLNYYSNKRRVIVLFCYVFVLLCVAKTASYYVRLNMAPFLKHVALVLESERESERLRHSPATHTHRGGCAASSLLWELAGGEWQRGRVPRKQNRSRETAAGLSVSMMEVKLWTVACVLLLTDGSSAQNGRWPLCLFVCLFSFFLCWLLR